MKILLDENVPHKLRLDLGGGDKIFTVQFMDWFGKKNGELLGLMTLNGFDVLITLDKNLRFQQNLNRFPISIILLDVENGKYESIEPLVPRILKALKSELRPSEVIIIEP